MSFYSKTNRFNTYKSQNARPRSAHSYIVLPAYRYNCCVETTTQQMKIEKSFFLLNALAWIFGSFKCILSCPSHPLQIWSIQWLGNGASIIYNGEQLYDSSPLIPWRAPTPKDRLTALQLVLLALPWVSLVR
jgi:hypothetical protein